MSPDEGDRIVLNALSQARGDANSNRLRRFDDNRFYRGVCVGEVIIAKNHLGADPLLAEGAINEIIFLGNYTEGRA